MAKAKTYELPCPYCGTHTFTVCPSILTGAIPEEIRHLVFCNVMCIECQSTFAEKVMTDLGRNRAQRVMYLEANGLPTVQVAA